MQWLSIYNVSDRYLSSI